MVSVDHAGALSTTSGFDYSLKTHLVSEFIIQQAIFKNYFKKLKKTGSNEHCTQELSIVAGMSM